MKKRTVAALFLSDSAISASSDRTARPTVSKLTFVRVRRPNRSARGDISRRFDANPAEHKSHVFPECSRPNERSLGRIELRSAAIHAPRCETLPPLRGADRRFLPRCFAIRETSSFRALTFHFLFRPAIISFTLPRCIFSRLRGTGIPLAEIVIGSFGEPIEEIVLISLTTSSA